MSNQPPAPEPTEVSVTELGQPTASPPSATSRESGNVGEGSTGVAPTFRPLVRADGGKVHSVGLPGIGDQIGDFDILGVLGAGSFARVYLARQRSLDRQVALKVSANRGTEARTLASLEHDHIVHVFSEVIDDEHDLRLLCMQYVPGTTLDRVIHLLAGRAPRTWSGRAILDAIDTLSTQPTAFDPAALRDREQLAGSDFVEAICWIGSRLAEALAHAHGQRVLHRDIKPANILLNPYGRPLLADFNLALDPHRLCGPAGDTFGGTLAYMSPEHLDAFNPCKVTPVEAVDERSDIYSLGVVLYELLGGKTPFRNLSRVPGIIDPLEAMAAERRGGPPPLPQPVEGAEVLERILRKCLDAQPEGRYQSAAELARALDGCRDLRAVARQLPAGGWLTRAASTSPFFWMGFLVLLPHLIGSGVNIAYNFLRIVLTPAQKVAFGQVTLDYNAVVYSFSLGMIVWLFLPILRGWRRVQGAELLDPREAADLRRRVLRLPLWAVFLSALGWLPGGLCFPLGIDLLAGPTGWDVYGHFLISFTVSGMIALTYAVLDIQFVTLRIFYPRLWGDGRGLREQAAAELGPLDRRLRGLQLLAGLIPLAGAVLMVGVGPEQFTPEGYRDFRILVSALILLGMAGFAIALSASGFLGRTYVALTGLGRHSRHAPLATPERGRAEVQAGN
jgi:serine/threonine protein kinase